LDHENFLVRDRCVLLATHKDAIEESLRASFLGDVKSSLTKDDATKIIYMAGEMNDLVDHLSSVFADEPASPIILKPIDSRALNPDSLAALPSYFSVNFVTDGQVPRSVYGLGVLFPRLFNDFSERFAALEGAHTFQVLRESTKPAPAHRSGIYLTPVSDDGEGCRRFRLLRCSTNLEGPTEDFKEPDYEIVNVLNTMTPYLFGKSSACNRTEAANPWFNLTEVANLRFNLTEVANPWFNHVLAQIYHNSRSGPPGRTKEHRARIAKHADKTKDMPPDGLMAFVTLYRGDDAFKALKPSNPEDPYDLFYRKTSALTRLRFHVKEDIDRLMMTTLGLPATFDIVLYPGSVFMMALDTNRLYTHEIVPPALPVERLPTRLGYVVRCSDQEAFFDSSSDQVLLIDKTDPSNTYPLLPLTDDKAKALRASYVKENQTSKWVDYGFVDVSFNQGDYLRPLI
jgi:hypothetical protein